MNPERATHNRPHFGGFALVVLWLMLMCSLASAQDYSIDWCSLSGGGGSSTGGAYAVSGYIGQSSAGPMSGGTFVLSGGISGVGAFTPVTNAAPLSVSKLQAAVNFAKSNQDSCSLTATLNLGANFRPNGQTLTLTVGGAQMTYSLNKTGAGTYGKSTCRLTHAKGASQWKLAATWKGGSWQTSWASYGLVNATVKKPGNAVTLPVQVDVAGEEFAGDSPTLHYTATLNKSGTAK